MDVAVARNLYVARDAVDMQTALARLAQAHAGMVALAQHPDGRNRSHITAYAGTPGATEASALCTARATKSPENSKPCARSASSTSSSTAQSPPDRASDGSPPRSCPRSLALVEQASAWRAPQSRVGVRQGEPTATFADLSHAARTHGVVRGTRSKDCPRSCAKRSDEPLILDRLKFGVGRAV